MIVSKTPYGKFIETNCGITMTPEREVVLKIKLPPKKVETNTATTKQQRPAYDEETIFNNQDIVNRINEIFDSKSINQLVNLYEYLNNWHLPVIISEILGMPKYLYEQFDMLPVSVRNKTIGPLINLLKSAIVKKSVNEFKTQIAPRNEKQTWEEYTANEH